MNWKLDYLERQFPKLEKDIKRLVDKVKPLIYLTDREVAVYNISNGIDYVDYDCPLSKGASSSKYKHVLSTLEEIMRGSKHKLLFDFYRNKSNLLPEKKEKIINENICNICGYPTTQEICNFCSLKKRVLDYEDN